MKILKGTWKSIGQSTYRDCIACISCLWCCYPSCYSGVMILKYVLPNNRKPHLWPSAQEKFLTSKRSIWRKRKSSFKTGECVTCQLYSSSTLLYSQENLFFISQLPAALLPPHRVFRLEQANLTSLHICQTVSWGFIAFRVFHCLEILPKDRGDAFIALL